MTWEVMASAQPASDALVMTTTRSTSAQSATAIATPSSAGANPGTNARGVNSTATEPIETEPGSRKHAERPGIRRLLLADAVLTGVNGLAYVVLPGLLGGAFGIRSGLLVGLGIFLLVVAAEITVLATRPRIPRWGVQILAEVNIAWAVASLVFAAVASLTALGVVWVIAQALIVAAFAAGQLILIRRPRATS